MVNRNPSAASAYSHGDQHATGFSNRSDALFLQSGHYEYRNRSNSTPQPLMQQQLVTWLAASALDRLSCVRELRYYI